MRSFRSTPLAAALAVAVLLGACGSDDGGPGSTASTGSTSSTSSTAPEPLSGERVDIFPYADAELVVVGVEADDVLNVRARPGTEGTIIGELEPLAEDVVATGHNRQLRDGSLWSEIRADGRTGWANSRFLLQPGQVGDITAALWPDVADRPSAATMLELGQLVAGLRASTEPPSRIVVVDGPTEGDLGQVTLDVIGLGDDSIGGERLFVFGQPDPRSDRFTARTIEAMTLCSRGVTTDQLCL